MDDFDKDVFGQADALLRRHSANARGEASETSGVPVLTDLVETPDGEPPPPAEGAPGQAVTSPEQAVASPADDIDDLGAFDPHLELEPVAEDATEGDIRQQVIDRVLAEVEQRLAADLERRVLEHLTPQVHAAVASALGDLHQELANAIGDAITQALERRPVK